MNRQTGKSLRTQIGRSLAVALMLSLLLAPAAQAQTVSVIFPNLANGQTIGGKINLSVTVNAPQPIASVEYRLNEQSLAKITIAPFNYEWDTGATAPGTYTLSAIVVDKAGNTGLAQVEITVAKPVQVAISAAQDTIHVGDAVTLNAIVSALVDVSRVELLIDGQSISTDTTPPFAFTFDSTAYQAGLHTVIIRAEDVLGRQGEASLDLQFNAADQTGWLRALIVVAVIATVIAAIFALWRTLKLARRSYLRTARVAVHNLGNMRSRYELRAEDAAGILKFQLLLNDVALPVVGAFAPIKEVKAQSIPAPASGQALHVPDGIQQSGGALADLLMSIGGALPGSIGRALMSAGGNLRQAQYTATRAQDATNRLTLAKSKSTTPGASSPSTPAPSIPAPSTLPVWQTPYLEPDEALTLKLVIDPGRPRQTQRYPFQFSSRSIDHAGAEAQVIDTMVNIEGMSLLRLYLPFFIVASVTLAIILIIALLVSNSGVLS